MARRLNTTVWLQETPVSEPVAFGPEHTDIPKWARDRIGDHCYGADDADGDGDGEDKPYGEWLKADLEAEIDARNEGRDDDAKLSKAGTKADLAAVLEADDADGDGA